MSQEDQPGQPVPHQPPPGVPPVLPSPAVVPPPQIPAGLPFDFYDFVRQTGGNTSSLFRTVHDIDKQLPRGPIIVHSER